MLKLIRKITKKILSKFLLATYIVGVKIEFKNKEVIVKNNICIIDGIEFKFRITNKDVKVVCKSNNEALILPHKEVEVDNVRVVLNFINRQLIINS